MVEVVEVALPVLVDHLEQDHLLDLAEVPPGEVLARALLVVPLRAGEQGRAQLVAPPVGGLLGVPVGPEGLLEAQRQGVEVPLVGPAVLGAALVDGRLDLLLDHQVDVRPDGGVV
ncbi:MAG: hypothetical protein HYV15_05275 [Elusimicrobia bacterium]|nr:hypothetical protein [Elusimicrobiota bacterium]